MKGRTTIFNSKNKKKNQRLCGLLRKVKAITENNKLRRCLINKGRSKLGKIMLHKTIFTSTRRRKPHKYKSLHGQLMSRDLTSNITTSLQPKETLDQINSHKKLKSIMEAFTNNKDLKLVQAHSHQLSTQETHREAKHKYSYGEVLSMPTFTFLIIRNSNAFLNHIYH
jgi:hypothetical protein